MKKIFFLFVCLGLFAFSANAQKKACCASKAKGASTTEVSCSAAAAAAAETAASTDESIVRLVSNDGEVTYSRKEVCPVTGTVSQVAVEYCTKNNKFVNVSPSEEKASCTKKASATKVSSTEKKACCAGDKAGKACCSKPGEKASTEKAATGAKVKFVKAEEGQ